MIAIIEYVLINTFVHIGNIIRVIIVFCARSPLWAMIYAKGYPTIKQINVAITERLTDKANVPVCSFKAKILSKVNPPSGVVKV